MAFKNIYFIVDNVNEINLDQVKKIGAILVLRNPEKYDSSHEIMLFETVFVIYCSGEGCSLSEDLAFYMSENLGFNNKNVNITNVMLLKIIRNFISE